MKLITMYLLTIRFPQKISFLKKILSKQHLTKRIQTHIPKPHFTIVTDTYGWHKELDASKLHFKSHDQVVFNIIPKVSIPGKVPIPVLKHQLNAFSIRKPKPTVKSFLRNKHLP